jgi:hypothetical protein
MTTRWVRLALMLAALPATIVVCAVPANAEFHYRNVGASMSADWSSCPTEAVGPSCAITFIEAEEVGTNDDLSTPRNCVALQQLRVADYTYANACGAASVVGDASVMHGRVRGMIPARVCPNGQVTGCAPTVLDVSLDWTGTGNLVSFPARTYRYSYEPGQRCLLHYNPTRYREAVAGGRIDGLPDPLGELHDAALFFGGVINIGTDRDCYD